MFESIFFLLLSVLLFIFSFFWLRRIVKNINLLKLNYLPQLTEDEKEDLRLELSRDILLALISISLSIYLIIGIVLPRHEIMLKFSFQEGVRIMTGLSIDMLIKYLLGIGVFLIAFGLSVRFLPDLFPQKKDSIASKVLSISTSLILSLIFGLWIINSPTFDQILNQITVGFTGIITTFLTVLFTSISVYIFWKQIKAQIKP